MKTIALLSILVTILVAAPAAKAQNDATNRTKETCRAPKFVSMTNIWGSRQMRALRGGEKSAHPLKPTKGRPPGAFQQR